jgi:MFS-type transporter involved in bile tolerance (Atg22 family)
VINCTGNLAGFVSPFIVGRLSDLSGGKLLPGMLAIAVALLIGAAIVLRMPLKRACAASASAPNSSIPQRT